MRVRRVRLGFRDFVRLFFAMQRQPEFRRLYGEAAWWLGTLLLPLTYARMVRLHRPEAFLVELEGHIYGAVTISAGGEVRNGVMLGEGQTKRAVMRLLLREMTAYVWSPAATQRVFRARTLAGNRSLIQAARHAGARVEPSDLVLVTLPMGPLTFSWRASRPPRLQWLRAEAMVSLSLAGGAASRSPDAGGRPFDSLRTNRG